MRFGSILRRLAALFIPILGLLVAAPSTLGADATSSEEGLVPVYIGNHSNHDLFCTNPINWNSTNCSTIAKKYSNTPAGPIYFSRKDLDLGCDLHVSLAQLGLGQISGSGCAIKMATAGIDIARVKGVASKACEETFLPKSLLSSLYLGLTSVPVKIAAISSFCGLSILCDYMDSKSQLKIGLRDMVSNCPPNKAILVNIAGAQLHRNITQKNAPVYKDR